MFFLRFRLFFHFALFFYSVKWAIISNFCAILLWMKTTIKAMKEIERNKAASTNETISQQSTLLIRAENLIPNRLQTILLKKVMQLTTLHTHTHTYIWLLLLCFSLSLQNLIHRNYIGLLIFKTHSNRTFDHEIIKCASNVCILKWLYSLFLLWTRLQIKIVTQPSTTQPKWNAIKETSREKKQQQGAKFEDETKIYI